MDILQTIILGVIQGLTEFIPVSSSGHLVIAQHFLLGTSDHLYLEFINIGTVLALMIYFRKRLLQLGREVTEQKKYSLLRNIILTSIPAGLVGFLLSDFIDTTPFFGSIWTVVCTLAVVGVVMIILERLPKKSVVQDGQSLSWQRALTIGIAQITALMPGVSRSGSTIITGRLMGMAPAEAAEYSFLASLPIMLAVTCKLFIKSGDRAYFLEHLPSLIIGNVAAFCAGILAIGFLMRFLSKHGLQAFGWYRVVLAGVLAVTLLVQ
jgi:undecaprenyl-diphosphatase